MQLNPETIFGWSTSSVWKGKGEWMVSISLSSLESLFGEFVH
ncbi:MAG: hypothetical protein ACYCYP_06695 [Leptospirales bacterium]